MSECYDIAQPQCNDEFNIEHLNFDDRQLWNVNNVDSKHINNNDDNCGWLHGLD